MQVIFKHPPVNQRRYGKGWIAKVVSWPIGKAPVLEFGANLDYITSEIEAEVGDIVKYGQKDHRGNGTVNEFGIINESGGVDQLQAAEAAAAYRAKLPRE